MTSCTPVLDCNIDYFLTKKWLKNIKALSLNNSQKTADALESTQSRLFFISKTFKYYIQGL